MAMNMDGSLPTSTVAEPTGLITKMIDWSLHPTFSDSNPWDWFAFVVLFFMAGLLWSKVVRQTLDAVI